MAGQRYIRDHREWQSADLIAGLAPRGHECGECQEDTRRPISIEVVYDASHSPALLAKKMIRPSLRSPFFRRLEMPELRRQQEIVNDLQCAADQQWPGERGGREFAPCLLWIFLGAPYIEALRSNRALHAALSGVTAAVVGIVLNLSVWFALHTLFDKTQAIRYGWMAFDWPQWQTVRLAAAVLVVAALLAMLRFRIGMGWTLLGSAAGGAASLALRLA